MENFTSINTVSTKMGVIMKISFLFKHALIGSILFSLSCTPQGQQFVKDMGYIAAGTAVQEAIKKELGAYEKHNVNVNVNQGSESGTQRHVEPVSYKGEILVRHFKSHKSKNYGGISASLMKAMRSRAKSISFYGLCWYDSVHFDEDYVKYIWHSGDITRYFYDQAYLARIIKKDKDQNMRGDHYIVLVENNKGEDLDIKVFQSEQDAEEFLKILQFLVERSESTHNAETILGFGSMCFNSHKVALEMLRKTIDEAQDRKNSNIEDRYLSYYESDGSKNIVYYRQLKAMSTSSFYDEKTKQTRFVLMYKHGNENDGQPIYNGVVFDQKEHALIVQSALEYLRDI